MKVKRPKDWIVKIVKKKEIIRIFHLVPGMRLTVLFYAEDMSFVSRFIGPKTTFFSFSSFHSVSVASKGAKRIPLRLVNHVCIL